MEYSITSWFLLSTKGNPTLSVPYSLTPSALVEAIQAPGQAWMLAWFMRCSRSCFLPGSSGQRVQGAFPLPGSRHHKVVTHCAFVSVLLLAGDPVKWFFGGKNQRAEVAQKGRENASAALSLGRISADLRAGHGATPQLGQQLSCPGDPLCCVL